MKQPARFIPAMHFHWLTPLFDWIAKRTLPDRELKENLIDQGRIEPGHNLLDLSCGTATLALLIKHRHPGARGIGLDSDPEILTIARQKVLNAGLEIDLGARRPGFPTRMRLSTGCCPVSRSIT